MAEVVFVKRSDALAAMKRYNNVHLDGKPMKIEIIGTNVGAPVPLSARVNVVGGPNGRGKRIVTMMYVKPDHTIFSYIYKRFCNLMIWGGDLSDSIAIIGLEGKQLHLVLSLVVPGMHFMIKYLDGSSYSLGSTL